MILFSVNIMAASIGVPRAISIKHTVKMASLIIIPAINTGNVSHLFFKCKTSSSLSLSVYSFRNCETSKAPIFINFILCSISTVFCTRTSVSRASYSSNISVFLRMQMRIEMTAMRTTTPTNPAIPNRTTIMMRLKIKP
jgi:hypothetical protein